MSAKKKRIKIKVKLGWVLLSKLYKRCSKQFRYQELLEIATNYSLFHTAPDHNNQSCNDLLILLS